MSASRQAAPELLRHKDGDAGTCQHTTRLSTDSGCPPASADTQPSTSATPGQDGIGMPPASIWRVTSTWSCGRASSASFAPTRSRCFASALAPAPALPPQCSSTQKRFARTCTPCFGTLLALQPGLPSPTRSPRPPRLSTCTEQMKQSAGRSHRRQTCPHPLPPWPGQPASSSRPLLSIASAPARGPVVDGCSSIPPDGAAGVSWASVATAKKRDASPQGTKAPRLDAFPGPRQSRNRPSHTRESRSRGNRGDADDILKVDPGIRVARLAGGSGGTGSAHRRGRRARRPARRPVAQVASSGETEHDDESSAYLMARDFVVVVRS